jgi:hypothetical protein
MLGFDGLACSLYLAINLSRSSSPACSIAEAKKTGSSSEEVIVVIRAKGFKPAMEKIVLLAAAGTAVALELVAGKVWALPKTPKASSRRCRVAGTGPRCTR